MKRRKAQYGLAMFLACGTLSCAELEATDGQDPQEVGSGELAKSEDALLGAVKQGYASVISPGTMTTDPYNSAAPGHGWNSSGGAITVANPSTGVYDVYFSGLGTSGGNAQVVAANTYYNGSNGQNYRCKVTTWQPDYWVPTVQRVGVKCHKPDGTPTNGPFNVWFSTPAPSTKGAFLYAEQPTTYYYTPSAAFNWNSTGVANEIYRAAVGQYSVILKGMASNGTSAGNVRVTALGEDGSHCKPTTWIPSGPDVLASIYCFNSSGAASDQQFSLNFLAAGTGPTTNYGAYSYAYWPTEASYTLTGDFTYNSGWDLCPRNSTNVAKRYYVGTYSMTHTAARPSGATVHVSAFGQDSSYCNALLVPREFTSANEPWNTVVEIRCYNAAGAPTDSPYVESFGKAHDRAPCLF